MNYVGIHFFVEPHIKKFLFQSIVDPKSGRLIIDRKKDPLISTILCLFLQKKKDFHMHNHSRSQIKSFSTIEIYINREYIYRFGVFQSPKDFNRFNSIIHSIFLEKLHSYVFAANTYSRVSVSRAIVDFCSLFDIDDDDVNIDSLVRQYYRIEDKKLA